MPDKYKPDEQYIRQIPNRRLHLYTLVQIVMLFVLCVFKVVTSISIIFPIMVRETAIDLCLHVHFVTCVEFTAHVHICTLVTVWHVLHKCAEELLYM